MKRVLVTGAAGAVGINTLKYLLSEGKYEITAVDLPNNKSYKNLKKYKRRINIVFADLTDPVITDGLVKDQDYIIHLASVTPNLGNVKKELCELVDYKITENIVRAISFYNPNCHLIFTSTTCLYKSSLTEVSVKSKESILKEDYYSVYKLKSESLIKKNVNNYTIFRLPMILTNPANNYFVYNGVNEEIIEVVSDLDVSYALVKSLDKMVVLNKKIYNLAGGKSCQIQYKDLINKVLLIYGISFKYFVNLICINKNYHGFIYSDSDNLNNIINFRNDSVSSFLMRLQRQTKKRVIQRLIARIVVKIRNWQKWLELLLKAEEQEVHIK